VKIINTDEGLTKSSL